MTTGPLQADMLQADWHPPVGEKPSAEAGSHSGLAALLLALSDAPKARDFRRCICFEPEISAAEARVIAHHADHVTLTNLQTLEVDVAHHLAGCSYLAIPSWRRWNRTPPANWQGFGKH